MGRTVTTVFIVLAFGAGTAAHGQDPNHLMRTNCVACHNEYTLQAGLNLQAFDANRPDLDPVIAEKIIRKLRSGQMPPREMLRDQAQLDNLILTLESGLDRFANET
ncbi:MAG: c-type cytochrome domain-containing protein, partial [Pseudomonadota bacterium]|nr:c-type cytochrome domain-containing protein [Pseudomonadota bacterium]